MPSIRTAVLVVVAAFAAVSQADYSIDPTTVPFATRQQWCTSEKTTCPIICEQTAPHTTLVNTCDPATLTYGCICGNGQQPNVSEYTLTLPYFVCTQWGINCVAGCKSDNACASSCTQDHPCGAQNPQRVNTTSSATMSATASATQSSNAIYTNALGATGSSTPGQGAASTLELGRLYGSVAVAVGVFAGFGFLL